MGGAGARFRKFSCYLRGHEFEADRGRCAGFDSRLRGPAHLLAGVVDGQTHATSCRGLPAIAATMRGAPAGGITSLVDMSPDNPRPLDRPDRFDARAGAVATYDYADFALYGTVTAESGTRHLAALTDHGTVAVRISAFESSANRFPRIPADRALDLVESLAGKGIPPGLHNEDRVIALARMAPARAAGADGTGGAPMPARSPPNLPRRCSSWHSVRRRGACAFRGSDDRRGIRCRRAGRGAPAIGELCVHYLALDAARDGARPGARVKITAGPGRRHLRSVAGGHGRQGRAHRHGPIQHAQFR